MTTVSKFTYADLVDSIYGGTVRADCRSFGQGLRPMPLHHLKRDWASLPSYDFGHLLNEGHPDFLGERIREALAAEGVGMREDGVFSLNADVVRQGGAAYLVWYQGRRCIITAFPEPPPPGAPAHDEHLNIDAFWWSPKHGRFLADIGKREWALMFPPICMSLLRNPRTIFEMIEDPKLPLINQRQKGRKLSKIEPTIRVIHLTKVAKIGAARALPHQGGTHRSPIPHDRAPQGYSRTYKRTGVTKWYPGPIKVKGGSEAAGAVRYEVRP